MLYCGSSLFIVTVFQFLWFTFKCMIFHLYRRFHHLFCTWFACEGLSLFLCVPNFVCGFCIRNFLYLYLSSHLSGNYFRYWNIVHTTVAAAVCRFLQEHPRPIPGAQLEKPRVHPHTNLQIPRLSHILCLSLLYTDIYLLCTFYCFISYSLDLPQFKCQYTAGDGKS